MRTDTLTADQRRELIERPFPTIRVVGHSSAWGGAYVPDPAPEQDRETYLWTPEDEELYAEGQSTAFRHR